MSVLILADALPGFCRGGHPGCAASLASALDDARKLVRDMLGPEPDFAAAVPYHDLDTVRAASPGAETADYLAAAVQSGSVTGPDALTGLTAGPAAAFCRAAPLLA